MPSSNRSSFGPSTCRPRTSTGPWYAGSTAHRTFCPVQALPKKLLVDGIGYT